MVSNLRVRDVKEAGDVLALLAVDNYVADFDALYRLAWDAFLIVMKESTGLARLSDEQILQTVATRDVRTHLAIAEYLEAVCKEMEGYPISGGNEVELRAYIDKLRYFRSVIVKGKNVRLAR
jgi:hypothetical protein